jgi:hypothetical protein
MPGRLRGFLDRGSAAENDEIGERDLLAAGLRGVSAFSRFGADP